MFHYSSKKSPLRQKKGSGWAPQRVKHLTNQKNENERFIIS